MFPKEAMGGWGEECGSLASSPLPWVQDGPFWGPTAEICRPPYTQSLQPRPFPQPLRRSWLLPLTLAEQLQAPPLLAHLQAQHLLQHLLPLRLLRQPHALQLLRVQPQQRPAWGRGEGRGRSQLPVGVRSPGGERRRGARDSETERETEEMEGGTQRHKEAEIPERA